MAKIFTEMGYGNGTFFSTEIEEGDREYRIPKFVKPTEIEGFYFRFWFFKTVFAFSTERGFNVQKKTENKLKILFGVRGVG